MNWNEIRKELSQLTALVEDWRDGKEVGALERELALEKLRTLYAAIRFAEDPNTGAVSVGTPADSEKQMPLATPAPVEMPAPAPAPAEAPAADVAVPAVEPAADALSVSETEAEMEPVVEPEAMPVPTPEPVVATQPDSPVSTVAESSPATTLFGPEENDATRHRRKQRVIMSLYGDEEEAEPAAAEPQPEPEKWAGLVTHVAYPDRPLRPDSDRGNDSSPVTFEEISVETVVIEEDEPMAVEEEMPLAGPAPASEPALDSDPFAAPEFDVTPDVVVAPEPQPESDAAAESEMIPEPASEPEAVDASEMESVSESESESESEPMPAAHPIFEPEPEPEPADEQPVPVLGEVMNHDVQTLADTIEAPRQVVSDMLRHEAISDLRRAIGLNDKFLLIRDLFGGDSDLYEREMQRFNDFDNLDDCMIYIAENHTWNPNAESVQILMELLERKFA